MTDRIVLSTPDGDLPVDRSRPGGDARGAVVVVQEAFGVNDHIRSLCDRLAAEGWYAVAPHLFHRQGSPEFGYDDFAQVMPAMGALEEAGIRADLEVTFAHLADEGCGAAATGIVGFCMGGTVALWAAATWELGAAVTFYGGGIAEGRFGFPAGAELATALRTPWLGLYGDQDRGIPVEQVEAVRAAIAGAAVDAEVVRYADADHGFNCDARGSFHAESAADAWQRTLDWFGRHL